ncbi:SGNH/GDSL hydrolase family protein [Nocardioides mesophilus]|uniref:SGNH/GDSL hydrolase family protein n=1 Tax=Nocardioides mesophilus TaxID=433659 RepID=A0A7G9R9S5_9ACTN|nr:SGNH/GDSL hydrolase family protein [Nocardioides mesophilus]QNN52350.1 SGNH/GDSL hydrolase family protein [Nocardioides mesophilus]
MIQRLVALGDSTVEGLEDPGPDGTYIGWADRFARRLAVENPGLLYANLAVRGQTSLEVRETQLDRALEMRPDMVLLVAGVNDLLRPRVDRAALRDNLMQMFRALREQGTHVVTFTMPDMARVAPLAFALRPRIEFLNRVLRDAGAAYGVTVVDLAAEPVASHPALWHDDRLHANSDGHRRIAAALAEALGLEADDWRAEPGETIPRGWLRIVLGETAWAGTHLAPWVWGRLRGEEFDGGGNCKRPDLLPVV